MGLVWEGAPDRSHGILTITKPTIEELLNDIEVVAIEHGHESHVERVLVALRERLVGEQQQCTCDDADPYDAQAAVYGGTCPIHDPLREPSDGKE